MPDNFLQNFSTNYRETLAQAINLSWQLKSPTVQPAMLLYALFLQKGSIGSEILHKAKIKKEIFSPLLKANNKGAAEDKDSYPQLDKATIKIIEKSAVLAYGQKQPCIATEHLLQSLIESNQPSLEDLFKMNHINKNFIQNQLHIIFNSAAKFQNFTSNFNGYQPELDENSVLGYPTTKKALAQNFSLDLTDKKIQKNIDPVIGRETEITRLIEILMRRTKNNPLILGDPGVGKTALVEGLAKRIIDGQVPDILADKKILAIDIASIVAGTMFRGEFENRMKNILEEIKSDPNIIIFIDEIHNIIGAGSTQGSMDIANILKPALARGEIRCIGATTYEEYKKHLEGDPALERRFQLIKIDEPNIAATKDIIQGVIGNYEIYHQVKISEPAINAAIQLSHKYITDRFFPDKALDLLDEASSKVKIGQKPNDLSQRIKEKETKLLEIKKYKEDAILQENFKQAVLLKAEATDLEENLAKLKTKLQQTVDLKTIGANEIYEIVSKITHIPVGELLLQENANLLNLEKLLAEKIIGQETAHKQIAQTIRRAKTGISAGSKPLGSFIFIGPSGTGKTHTAKILSQILFNRPDSLVKIDMSEFSEKFNISKLIGAPAGYVGYKDNNKLTDAVKRNPNSVVLFDEIEKAHPDVFNLLLQILDEGYLTDAGGKKINFKNTIIIMTSNLGTEKLNKLIGFDKTSLPQAEATLLSEIKKFFRPEFINRLDKIIFFEQLTEKTLQNIAKNNLTALQERLIAQNITLLINPKVAELLQQKNYNPDQGARYIQQNIEELIEVPLAEAILRNTNQKKNFKLSVKNNNLILSNG